MASGKAPNSSKNRSSVKDCILTAIDQLKVRKARPDRYRIAYVLNKQFGVGVDAVNEALEQMTDEHTIVRVDYKGSVSYRDIKNWVRVNDNIQKISMYAGALVLNSDRATAAIQEAVKTLAAEKKTSAVTLNELEKYFNRKEHEQYTTAPLTVAIQREVNAGNLVRVGSEGVALNKSAKSKQSEMHRIESPTSDGTSDGNEAPNDSGKRVKKTKVIFDPSELRRPAFEPPPAKKPKKMVTASPTSSPARRICNFCSKTAKHEVVLVCRLCETPAHPSCLGYSRRLAKVVQDKPWTCMDCKTCKLCSDLGGELIFCDKCDEAYHMECHKPHVRKKPIGEWMCTDCRGGKVGPGRPPKLAWKPEPPSPPREEKPSPKPAPKPVSKPVTRNVTKPITRPASKTPTKPVAKPIAKALSKPGPKPGTKHGGIKVATKPATGEPSSERCARLGFSEEVMAAPLDPSVPDAAEWTVDQVAAYFGRHGFPEHSAAFRQHHVDGAALLMMTRMDVLRGLGLKLGPALKIYNHVKLLQTRRRACLDFCLL